MNKEQIRQFLIDEARELTQCDITWDSPMCGGAIDSLDRVKLLMALEEEYEIDIEDSVAEGWVDMNIAQVANQIHTILAGMQ